VGNFALYNGGGGRLGLTVGRGLFLRSISTQDSIVMELGLFAYKVLNFARDGDTYTIAPLIGTIRYNIWINEGFFFFIYSGLSKNFVISSQRDDGDGESLLSTIIPAGGGGFFFRAGPKWFIRFDLGFDMIGAGLVLRF